MIQLGLTSEDIILNEGQLNIKQWFNQHIQNNHLENLFNSLKLNEYLNQQFQFLGFEEETIIPSTFNTNAQILQWILENKWKLESTDKDLVIMMHEITYTLDNQIHQVQSSLVVKGKNDIETAMATTVGLPLAMAVCAFLKGELNITGLHIPIDPIIYQPILKALHHEGICFKEIEL
jgi:hypothetical protein